MADREAFRVRPYTSPFPLILPSGNWKLRYTQPQLKPGNIIVREEMLEDMGTENYQDALTRAQDFLSKGGIVIDAQHHRREQVSLIQGTPTPGTEAIRDAFFAHKAKNPAPFPYDQLTSLQKRMQSGSSRPSEPT